MPRGHSAYDFQQDAQEFEFDDYILPGVCLRIYGGVCDKNGMNKNEITNRVGVKVF